MRRAVPLRVPTRLAELSSFPGLAEMILGALNPGLRPRPIPDPEGEKAFAKFRVGVLPLLGLKPRAR